MNFPNSIYPAANFNFGPITVCVPHVDQANDPCNWCHVTPFGTFNPRRGGHLVLHTLKLIVEFPPGSHILFPSALIEHSNIAVRRRETRQSLTQYCAGGLMRWVACGFQTLADFAKRDPDGKAAYDAQLPHRVTECLARFTHILDI